MLVNFSYNVYFCKIFVATCDYATTLTISAGITYYMELMVVPGQLYNGDKENTTVCVMLSAWLLCAFPFKLYIAKAGKFRSRETYVNNMLADALTPCVTRPWSPKFILLTKGLFVECQYHLHIFANSVGRRAEVTASIYLDILISVLVIVLGGTHFIHNVDKIGNTTTRYHYKFNIYDVISVGGAYARILANIDINQ